MVALSDIVARVSPPAPWSEGDNIPWDEPDFSKRMLEEHLAQEHDLASRRSTRIDEHVVALTRKIAPPPARVLDLACGPGLYLTRFAAAGYSGVGIDFSPASIEYARGEADTRGHEIEYHLADLRTARFGTGFDAVLLLYGQLNVFRRDETYSILTRAHEAMVPGGSLVVEPQRSEHIEQAGQAAPNWSSHQTGLFSERPHLLLTESFWDADLRASTERFFVVDAASGEVTRYALSNEAYTEPELMALLDDIGFEDVELLPSLTGNEQNDGLFVVSGRKRTAALQP